MFTLVKWRSDWYRSDKKLTVRATHFFDVIVTIEDGQYNVLKNRNGRPGTVPDNDPVRMKLWLEGKTFMDLPTFTENNKDMPKNGPLSLVKDQENNLLTVNTFDPYYPKN